MRVASSYYFNILEWLYKVMSKKITEFVKDLNKAFLDDGIDKAVKVNELHKWLKSHGYVENKKDKKNDTFRHVTKAGKEIGLKNVTKDYGDKTIEFVRKAKTLIEDQMIAEEGLVKKVVEKPAKKTQTKKTVAKKVPAKK